MNTIQVYPMAQDKVDASNIVKVAQVLLQELHKHIDDLRDKEEVGRKNSTSTAGHTILDDPAEELDIRQHLTFLGKVNEAAVKFGSVLSSEMKK